MSSKHIRLAIFILIPILFVYVQYIIFINTIKWYWVLLSESLIFAFGWMFFVLAFSRIEFYDTYLKAFHVRCRRMNYKEIKTITFIPCVGHGINSTYKFCFEFKNSKKTFEIEYFQLRTYILFFKDDSGKKPAEKVFERVREIIFKKIIK